MKADPRSFVACLLLAACGTGTSGEVFTAAERARILKLEWPEGLKPPPDPSNRVADDPAAALLGQKLFFDAALSADGTISCAKCHDPAKAFTDGLATGKGYFSGNRNTPTVLGASFSRWLFLDGRKDSLWSQALGPIENRIEHDFTRMELVRILSTKYRSEYEALFGALPPASDARFPRRAKPDGARPDSAENVAWLAMAEADRAAVNTAYANAGKAIAAYERRLSPSRAPFDVFVADLRNDRESKAISDDAVAGLRLFIGRGNCVACHDGPHFTDDEFHNLGLGGENTDRGRRLGAEQVLTDPFGCRGGFNDAPRDCGELDHLNPAYVDFEGAFRTPSLRFASLTAPYLHDGRLATLDQVLRFYSDLPDTPSIGHREATLKPLHLTDVERRQLVAFLESLTGPLPDAALLRAP